MEKQITFGEYYHLKNLYEDLKEESSKQIKFWEEECDRRQHVIKMLRQSTHPEVTAEEIQKILDRLFPPADELPDVQEDTQGSTVR